MFNLIVAVISIALIAALAAASIFYGGDSFSSSSARAEAATLISQGQQISGAMGLFRVDNSGNAAASEDPACSSGTTSACAINRLVAGGYLQAIPSFNPEHAVQSDQVTMTETGFGQPAGTFSWMPRWTISNNGDLARIFLNEIMADEICAEVEAQGGDTTIGWAFSLDAAGFHLDGEDAPLYRCAQIDLGIAGFPGEIVTAFGMRL